MNADRQGRATIKDVAREAGVSAMTVSNVINNKTQFVGAAARARVEEAIARLGYRRQSSARNLRGRAALDRHGDRRRIAGLPRQLLHRPARRGLANVLNRADWTLTLSGLHPDQLAASSLMRTYDVGGLCAMVSGERAARHDIVRRLSDLGQPVVLFQEVVETEGRDLCLVRQDDEGAAEGSAPISRVLACPASSRCCRARAGRRSRTGSPVSAGAGRRAGRRPARRPRRLFRRAGGASPLDRRTRPAGRGLGRQRPDRLGGAPPSSRPGRRGAGRRARRRFQRFSRPPARATAPDDPGLARLRARRAGGRGHAEASGDGHFETQDLCLPVAFSLARRVRPACGRGM